MLPLDILTIYSPSITLNLRNIFLIYITLESDDQEIKLNIDSYEEISFLGMPFLAKTKMKMKF